MANQKELMEKIKADMKERKEIRITRGAFGDINVEECTGIVEYVDPNEHGTFTKYYGVSPLFRGYPDLDVTEQMHLGKSMLSAIPREIVMQSFVLKCAFGFLAIFSRKRFYYYLSVYTRILRIHLEKLNVSNPILAGYKTNEPTREMRRAIHASLKRNGYTDVLSEAFSRKKGNLGNVIANLTEFLLFFIEHDSAYRHPLQDVLENLNKEAPIRVEVQRLFDLLIERSAETSPYLIRKFVYAKKITLALLRLPEFRKIMEIFLKELDLNKVGLNENDWYYCLLRKYRFRGLSLDERRKEKARIDKEKNHIILQFTKKNV